MPSYLFQTQQLPAFARYVAPDTLFAFDLDGILVPVAGERGAAMLAKPLRRALQRLAGLAKVALLTGRSRKDALALLGFQPHLLIGNHGAEWPGNGGRNGQFAWICRTWREQLRLGRFPPGVDIECRGASISLHYGKSPQPEAARSLIHAAVDALEPPPRRIGGRYVVDLVPGEAPAKGEALALAMGQLACKRGVYLGDDETGDESFCLQTDDLPGYGGWSATGHHLARQSEMLELLDSIVGILEGALGERPERSGKPVRRGKILRTETALADQIRALAGRKGLARMMKRR